MKKHLVITILCLPALTVFLPAPASGQKDELGNQQYVIVKDYKPVLAESYKISDLPAQDTATSKAAEFAYTLPEHRAETAYETALIKPVTIKDPSIQKLYRSLLNLGIGSQSTYNGELFVNSLRSKDFSAGLRLKHFSAKPNIDDVGDAGFSNNFAGLNGKYFLEKFTLSSELNFSRDAYHYYGFDTEDTIVKGDDYRQIFNIVDFSLGIEKRDVSKEGIDYAAVLDYAALRDNFEKEENDFILKGFLGKKISEYYGKLDISLDYFKKTDVNPVVLNKYHNLPRNIVNIEPSLLVRKDKFTLFLGLNMALEKNLESAFHVYPDIQLELPIQENVLTAFAGVSGKLVKHSYATVTKENPYVSPQVVPIPNTSENLTLDLGLRGNVGKGIAFGAFIRHTSANDMLFYVNDTEMNFPETFNIVYDDGSLTTLHAEAGYKPQEKLSITFQFEQFIYKTETLLKAWHKPSNEAALTFGYNLRDKIVANVQLFFRGSQYARELGTNGSETAIKLDGFADINLGIEYRYSKILSLYVNMNNLGFSNHYYWNNYPTEGFNILGGIKFAF